MPRITMKQVKVLQRFTQHYNYKNDNKVRLMERVKNYASYATWFERNKKIYPFYTQMALHQPATPHQQKLLE